MHKKARHSHFITYHRIPPASAGCTPNNNGLNYFFFNSCRRRSNIFTLFFKFMHKKNHNIHNLITLHSHFNHRIPPATAGCTPNNNGLTSTSTVLQCTHAIFSIALFSRKIAPLLAILSTTYSR